MKSLHCIPGHYTLECRLEGPGDIITWYVIGGVMIVLFALFALWFGKKYGGD